MRMHESIKSLNVVNVKLLNIFNELPNYSRNNFNSINCHKSLKTILRICILYPYVWYQCPKTGQGRVLTLEQQDHLFEEIQQHRHPADQFQAALRASNQGNRTTESIRHRGQITESPEFAGSLQPGCPRTVTVEVSTST